MAAPKRKRSIQNKKRRRKLIEYLPYGYGYGYIPRNRYALSEHMRSKMKGKPPVRPNAKPPYLSKNGISYTVYRLYKQVKKNRGKCFFR